MRVRIPSCSRSIIQGYHSAARMSVSKTDHLGSSPSAPAILIAALHRRALGSMDSSLSVRVRPERQNECVMVTYQHAVCVFDS